MTAGVGFETGKFFTDNEHPLVSLMSSIVPSPDWFVGVDSLTVCYFNVVTFETNDSTSLLLP